MRIQHNILAMNAYRNYNTNTSALSKNLEKLSSGYKINRAGDDAAGLAISEKMRAQITGLNAAQKNVKDGISLVKTAEGAMQEIQDMLNRMDYLATQSANGTYDNEVDRANLQKEVDALKTEIDRIADSANFNGINLLDGSQAGLSSKPGSAELENGWTDKNVTQVADGTPQRTAARGKYELDLSRASWTASAGTASVSATIAGLNVTVNGTGTNKPITGADIAKQFMTDHVAADGTVSIDGKTFKVTNSNGKLTFTGIDNTELKGSQKLAVTVQGTNIKQATTQTTKAPSGQTNGTTTVAGVTSGNQAWSMAFTQIERPVDAANTLAAQATFDLVQGDIVDGFTIKLGDETYTFAVGRNSEFKDKAGVIDMTDFEEGDNNIHVAAAMYLSGAANANKSVYVEADNTTGKVYLTEKLGGMDRDTWDMYGTKPNGKDAQWSSTDLGTFVKTGQAKPSDLPDSTAGSVSGGLTLQIGDTADTYNQLNVSIGDMHVAAIGIANIDISNQKGAQSAISDIKAAINYVSSVRGDLGAVQNRLEHTANNLSVMAENIQDAESTIRDTDIAEEMMSYTKNNILVQSAQAMLAQANAVPQGVLQLLG